MTKLHCVCRQPEVNGVALILCDRCDKWYHPKCLGIKDKEFAKIEEQPTWICKFCKDLGATTGIFDIDDILKRRPSTKKKGTYEYLIRWKGYGPKDDTWEPGSNLGACWELKEDFDEREDEKLKKKQESKSKKKTPKKATPKRKSSSSLSTPRDKKRRSSRGGHDSDDEGGVDVDKLDEVEQEFLREYGNKAFRELKIQLDAFVAKQKSKCANLTEHQLSVYKRTYVKVYTKNLKEEGSKKKPKVKK